VRKFGLEIGANFMHNFKSFLIVFSLPILSLPNPDQLQRSIVSTGDNFTVCRRSC